jgi:3',5'-cyclic AMP phosphodiesterase CpdA
MHVDADAIRKLFERHGNVRLALSGHMHMVDRVDFRGTTYLCNGAVSGGWWAGKYHDFDCCYAVVDLFADGSFERQIIATGWEHRS